MSISASALWGNLGVLGLLFVWKMIPKLVGVYPPARRSPLRTRSSRPCS
jgi:hypothetical protein